MRKSFLLLPLMVSMALTACNSSSSSEAETTEASATTSAIPTWQAEGIQSADMPASMSSAPTHTIGQAQTAYNNAQQTVQQIPQTVATQAQSSYGANSEMVGNCQVVRDDAGLPIYAQIAKGCYTGSNYTVGKSDTIFLIAYLTGTTPAQIATLNNISTTTKLQVGQILRVR